MDQPRVGGSGTGLWPRIDTGPFRFGAAGLPARLTDLPNADLVARCTKLLPALVAAWRTGSTPERSVRLLRRIAAPVPPGHALPGPGEHRRILCAMLTPEERARIGIGDSG